MTHNTIIFFMKITNLDLENNPSHKMSYPLPYYPTPIIFHPTCYFTLRIISPYVSFHPTNTIVALLQSLLLLLTHVRAEFVTPISTVSSSVTSLVIRDALSVITCKLSQCTGDRNWGGGESGFKHHTIIYVRTLVFREETRRLI